MKSLLVFLTTCLITASAFCHSSTNTSYLLADKPPAKSKYRTPRYSKKVILERMDDIEHGVEMRLNRLIRRIINSYVKGPGRRTTEKVVGLSAIYFPIFDQYIKKYNIPDELKYLSIVESALKPKARSHMGAAGLWQFMPKTGRLYGLQINNYVDERYNIHKASEAAAHYLHDLFERYQNWTLAIAAYNCGPGNLNKAIRKGRSKNFWKIKKHLPKETQEYVQRFIAIKYVMSYYVFYDIRPKYPDYNLVLTQPVKVLERKSFKQIAKETGIPLAIIEQLNPNFKKKVVPPSAQGHAILLPKIGTIETVPIEFLGYKSSSK